jgi:uncharacterized protein YeaO (DUF488 family)
MTFQIKRLYDAAAPTDGIRILVDRLWPRGISKQAARLDDWLKDIAPSPALRHWFGHKPDRFAEFSKRYRQELTSNPLLGALQQRGKDRTVTLLYAARDTEINHAVVLLSELQKRALPKKRQRSNSRPVTQGR